MAVGVTSKHASVLGSSSTQTRSSSSASYAAGARILLVGHALSDGHTNGLGTGGSGWATPTTNAVTNTITWTQVGSPTAINSSLGANYRVQSIMWISSVLTATESLTITIDAHNGGSGLFFYGINTVELTGSAGTLVQSAVADDPDGSDTATFGSTPSGFQLLVGYAVGSHDNIVWSAAPSNFSLLSGSTATPNGGTGCAIVTSSTNTATGVTWGWTTAGGTPLVTTLILVEIAEAASSTDYTKTPADPVGLTDARTVVQVTARTLDDAVGITDAVSTALDLVAMAADPVGVTDTAALALGAVRDLADPVGASDSVAAVADVERAPADAVGVTDAVVAELGQVVADTVGVTDSVSVEQVTARTLDDAVGITDAASGAVGSPLSDDFNRADSADLGADWTPVAGGMRIDTNSAYAGTVGGAGVLHRERWDGGSLPGPNMAVQGTIAQLSPDGYSDLRLMARWTGSTSYYELRVNNSGEWYINRVTSGGETDIASGTGLTLSLPEVWRLESEGTGPTVTLRVYRDDSLVGSHADTDGSRITTGDTGGIGGFTAGGTPSDIRLDDWSLSVVEAGAEYDKAPADTIGASDTVVTVAEVARAADDPVGIVDTAQVVADLARTVADPVGVTDAVSAVLGQVVADPVGLTDTVAVELATVRDLADPVGVTDDVTVDLESGGTNYTKTPADAVGITDAVAVAVDYVVVLADAVGITDTGAPQTLDIGYELDDPVGVADAVALVADAVRAPADAVGITDGVSVDATGATTRDLNDPVGATDAVSTVASSDRAVSDPVGVTDAVTWLMERVVTVEDLLGLTDAVGAAEGLPVAVADPVGVTDAVVAVLDVVRTPADAVGVGDTLTVARTVARTVADPVGVADAVASAWSGAVIADVAPWVRFGVRDRVRRGRAGGPRFKGSR